MVLHLAHHKSYHPYRAENIERVRKDEEEAERATAAEEKRSMVADSEARLSNLRKSAKKRLRGQQDEAEAALDRQLKGKGRATEDEEESRAVIVRPPAAVPEAGSSIELDGHINFWADLERGAMTGKPATAALKAGNADYEADAKKERTKFDEQITMYIREPPAPWYADATLLHPTDRKRTADERLEKAYKDGESKRLSDPLAMMNGYLHRRDRVLDAQDRMRRDPWGNTPRSLIDPSPVQPSLLRPRKRRRTPSPDPQAFAPPPPPRAKPAKLDVRTEAQVREASERERAAALIARAKRGGSSTVASTPRSEVDFGTGQYNAEATARARNLSHIRWDDHRRERDRDRRRDEDDRERDRDRYRRR